MGRKVCVYFVVAGILLILVRDGSFSRAVSRSLFLYNTDRGLSDTTMQFQQALDMCRKYGGTLVVQTDYMLKPEDYDSYIYIPANVRIIIPRDVRFVLGNVELWLDGRMDVEGTLDLSETGGILSGNGKLAVKQGGRLFRRVPQVEKRGEVCLQGTDLDDGQSLADSCVRQEEVFWKSSVPGRWSFANQDTIPNVGTALYDVVFTPQNLWTFEPVLFSACGRVTVKEQMPLPSPAPGQAEDPPQVKPPVEKPEEAEKRDAGKEENALDMFLEQEKGPERSEPVVVITRIASKISQIRRKAEPFSQKKPRLRKCMRDSGGMALSLAWTVVEGKTGYEVQYAASRSMKGGKKVRTVKANLLIKGLNKKKTYYVRVRAYRSKNKKRTYTKWSSLKQSKTVSRSQAAGNKSTR